MRTTVVFGLAAIATCVWVADVSAQHVRFAGYDSTTRNISSVRANQNPDANRGATIEVTPMPAVKRDLYGQAANRAHFQLILPDPEAEVWFEDVITRQYGAVRYFHTPPLPAGISTYTIRVRWNDGVRVQVQRREVEVHPGEAVMVDFRRP
jgi:uncharacterized protein (TIGR03000 family)